MTAIKLAFSTAILVVAQSVFVSVAQAADEPLVVVVKVFPGAGREDELQARYEKQLEFLRKSEPNATFRLLRSTESPTYFLWYETYPSRSALDHHLKTVIPAFKKEFGETANGLIARPSESITYRELGK